MHDTDRHPTGGIVVDGDEIRIDPKAVYYLHDVDRNTDPDDGNCPVCGEGYPCAIVEAVGQLEEALKTTVPSGAGSDKE